MERNCIGFDPFSSRYPSRRSLVYGTRGMIATSHPLAAGAGMEVMRAGGNAVDAAIAAAAALTVVEPTSNGIGSDVFAIIWKDGRLHGLNASGYVPSGMTLDRAREISKGGSLPRFGWEPVTVPGAPRAWAELSRKMGRVDLVRAIAPAVELARGGHAVAVTESQMWRDAIETFGHLKGEAFAGWHSTFCKNGAAPMPGDIIRLEDHARTLEVIAQTQAESFYTGEIASKIIDFSRRTGGYIKEEDLAEFYPEWVEPISVRFGGCDIWEMPPNGQGLTALLALGMMENIETVSHDDPRTIHAQIEAMKLAFADASRYVADMHFSKVPIGELLSDEYLASRAKEISDIAKTPSFGDPYSGGTVYLCTADAEGTMVSYIQSNYMGFGSGVVVPDTGVALNNRGVCASLEDGHPNILHPKKRPYNTIIPGFMTKDGEAVGPFGVMGAFMQPQGHLQVVMNMLRFGMTPQEALDAPRWQYISGRRVSCEAGLSANTAQSLARMGHDVVMSPSSMSFGRGQIILRDGDSLVGATEPRTDGSVIAW